VDEFEKAEGAAGFEAFVRGAQLLQPRERRL
jgi:hypothetical protein